MSFAMRLSLAAFLFSSGCSTDQHMLEPGVDKYQGATPHLVDCCASADCACDQDHRNRSCPACVRAQP